MKTILIPCRTSKVKNGRWMGSASCDLVDLGMEISCCVISLYPNHADSSDHSNLVIVGVKDET